MVEARTAHVDDIAHFTAMIERNRREYEHYAPLFWRPAEDATTKHQAFLNVVIGHADTLSLVLPAAQGIGAAIIATRREQDWMVDDFVVRTAEQWAGPGRILLDEVRRRVEDVPLIVVCAQLDVPKRTMLAEADGELVEEWWVRSLHDAGSSRDEASGAKARVIGAPPVYDPGGPVSQITEWDGTADALHSAMRWARGQGAVVMIVAVPVVDDIRRGQLIAAGFRVASEWYRFSSSNG